MKSLERGAVAEPLPATTRSSLPESPLLVHDHLHAGLDHEGEAVVEFREHEIPFDEELDYATVRFSFAGGYSAVQRLLERGREFTGIFAMSDVMAMGAIRALQDAGKRVPQDVSVVGFDGLLIGEYTVPRLTTICQAVEELAERSVKLLLESMEGRCNARYDTVPVTLSRKESVRDIH